MGYMETCESVKKGQTILQLGVGGGVKSGCNIWRALKDIDTVGAHTGPRCYQLNKARYGHMGCLQAKLHLALVMPWWMMVMRGWVRRVDPGQ